MNSIVINLLLKHTVRYKKDRIRQIKINTKRKKRKETGLKQNKNTSRT